MLTKRSQKPPHQGDFTKISCLLVPLFSRNFSSLIDIAKTRTAALTSAHNSKCLSFVTAQINNKVLHIWVYYLYLL